ncbi:MAG TPA: neutral/alkaline non-lysosomal ceramidase N-terminal domain-containing protein [Planctomycetota bacterium]|nr:neutral/alkaline non-lysosomal ceramidase N-terminal domain-containing protein [Planctomycetota bacterium]
MRIGFAEIDITPPIGISKIGWLIDIKSGCVLDPLFARAAVFENAGSRIGFVQVDTLSIRRTQVAELRRRIDAEFGAEFGFPGANVMIAATHNHAGPAIADVGEAKTDAEYTKTFMDKCVRVFGSAIRAAQEAEVGVNHVFDFAVASNRRVLMRDGTARTHGTFDDPGALCLEGPIDPEVAVLAARRKSGELIGCLLNYACHPTHHGPGPGLSAGYPGVLAAEMKRRGCPITLFLNGACGNTHHINPLGGDVSKEQAGQMLAADAQRAIEGMAFASTAEIAAASTVLDAPFRQATAEEIAGSIRGAQRFSDPGWYDRAMQDLLAEISVRKTRPAEVQALRIGNTAWAAIPAEYFVEFGLRIKRAAHPRHALVVEAANGMIGYVPTREAFEHGGYETTFAPTSCMAPETGDLLADAAVALIRGI